MGRPQRRERARRAVRRAILDAARRLFVEQGYRNVSIRRIAARVDYSAAAIYSYFPGKDAIFFALAEAGFQRLDAALERSRAGTDDPLDLLRRGFLAYYTFSKASPEYFGLMFVDRTVPRLAEDWSRFGFLHSAFERASAAITRCIEAGVFPAGTNVHAAFHILWAGVHGVATIGLCNLFAPGEDPDAMARDTLEAAIAGLRSGLATTFIGADYAALLCSPATSDGAPDAHD